MAFWPKDLFTPSPPPFFFGENFKIWRDQTSGPLFKLFQGPHLALGAFCGYGTYVGENPPKLDYCLNLMHCVRMLVALCACCTALRKYARLPNYMCRN